MAISDNAISRLPRYRAAIARLKTYAVSKVYSGDIADAVGITACQVRKDFSQFKFAGKKRVGYEIDFLLRKIDTLLGKRKVPSVLCGLSSSASVLALEQLSAAHGSNIIAAFDEVPGRLPKKAFLSDIPILPLDLLVGCIVRNNVVIGIIASQDENAQHLLDLLVLAGIRGILNLSGRELKSPKRCMVSSVNILGNYDTLLYHVNKASRKTRGAPV